MRHTLCLALLAACHAAPTSTLPNTAARLGPDLAAAELTARLADHRLRSLAPPALPDGEPSSFGGGVTITDDVIAAVDCYPEGPSTRFVADAHYLYAYIVTDHLTVPPDRNGRALPHPSSSCTTKRYRLPSGLAYGGVLNVVDPDRLATLSEAELTARLADHRLRAVTDVERLPDGGGDANEAMFGHAPSIVVEGDVVAALHCRPGGMGWSLVSDGKYLYIYFVSDQFRAAVGPGGEAQPTPSTYCSFQRFRIPAGLTYGGVLKIMAPTAKAPQSAHR
jgi:hypothetical protein